MRYVRTDTYKIYDDLRCTRAVLLNIDSYWLCANISITCTHCHAWTWAEESINCCSNGKCVVEPLIPLPPDIARLFQTRHFLTNQRRYRRLFSFTAMGAAPSPTWTQPSYPSMLQLHCRAYHRIMDGFRTNYSEQSPVVNKARMYMYCLLYTSPSPRDATLSRMPSSA